MDLLSLPLDFASTARYEPLGDRQEVLPDAGAFLSWAVTEGLITRSARTRLIDSGEAFHEVFHRALALRAVLQQLFSRAARQRPIPKDALDHLESIRREAEAHRRLVAEKGGVVLEWERTAEGDLILWKIAQAAVELLTGDSMRRLRECMGRDCSRLFLDRSRNGSRRWCDMTGCGNRAKVRRFYKRKRSGIEPG